MTKLDGFKLVLRAVMETGIVAALAYWGYAVGETTFMKVVLATGAPLIGFGFWGAIDFHQAGRMAEPLRLIEELFISGLTAVALYETGQHVSRGCWPAYRSCTMRWSISQGDAC